jgi:hypothetical protein
MLVDEGCVEIAAPVQVLIVTVLVSVCPQPRAFVMATLRTTDPEVPAVNVTFRVVAPAVIVPPVIVQRMVIPPPGFGIEAAFPVDDDATDAGAVISPRAGVMPSISAIMGIGTM